MSAAVDGLLFLLRLGPALVLAVTVAWLALATHRTSREIGGRAYGFGRSLQQTLACSAAAAESYAVATAEGGEGETYEAAIAHYRAAEQVVGHFMNQLYFGSGAYADNKDAEVGLKSVDAMRQFLTDYRPALELLTDSHEPATHHHLVELYEYLIPGDPSYVFNAVYELLLGAGAREGYHHESLASAVIVSMITRYIADHRSIFEDDVRRARLVEILKLFSDVGWSEALKLLYDLPDLLR